jgi:hypothetical protein
MARGRAEEIGRYSWQLTVEGELINRETQPWEIPAEMFTPENST